MYDAQYHQKNRIEAVTLACLPYQKHHSKQSRQTHLQIACGKVSQTDGTPIVLKDKKIEIANS